MAAARLPEGERRENRVWERSPSAEEWRWRIQALEESSKPKSLEIRVGNAREKKWRD